MDDSQVLDGLPEFVFELAQHSTDPNVMLEVFRYVLLERQRQDYKWGVQNHQHFVWNTILGEEIGEVAKAALHNKFGGEEKDNIKVELIQVIAVAVAWLECIERNKPVGVTEQG